MAIRIGTNNPGTSGKRVGGTESRYSIGGFSGVCGTPVWDDSAIWDDTEVWVD